MKPRVLVLSLSAAFLTIATSAHAQLIPILGSQRAGSAMAQFLKIGVGGRAVAMGESFVAISNDASALYWNPAGIAQMQKNELIFSHVNWPVEVKHEFLGYAHHFGEVNSVGVSVIALHTDSFEETTEYLPRGTGNYVAFSDVAVGVTYARKMTDKFSFGATVKYVDESLAELHARAVLVDFGTYYWTGWHSTRFAVAVANFGQNFKPTGSFIRRDGTEISKFQDFSPPTVFRLGVAAEVVDNEQHKMTTSVQLNHPNDNAENVNLGMEYWWNKTVALRGGYRVNVDEESFTFGGGIALPLSRSLLNFDISYTDFGRLGNATRLSAAIKL